MTPRLRIVIATHLTKNNVERLRSADPRIEVIWEPHLMPPMGTSTADWVRPDALQAAYESYVDSADALYGVPDQSGSALARTVRANSRLRWVHTIPAGGGAQVKAAKLTEDELSRIAFTTSAGIHARPLAEFALFGVLAGLKSYGRLSQHQRERNWGSKFEMRSIVGATVAVVGLGNIGRATAALLDSVGIQVIGVHRRQMEVKGVGRVVGLEKLAATLAEVDAVVLALPETEATRGILGSAELPREPKGLTVVNIGRGTTIDEKALLNSLDSGGVSTAVLDVTAVEPLPQSSRLWDHPGVILSPHTAAIRHDQAERIVDIVIDNARRLVEGRPLLNRVNTVEFY